MRAKWMHLSMGALLDFPKSSVFAEFNSTPVDPTGPRREPFAAGRNPLAPQSAGQ
jgi:hypothetical protein